ncbi:uncharacterized protein LOC103317710 [Nasonia vitripennis]|uniref:Uncharacterized protein n=1 Tax=Nasonia vitripennis TaxID=7425 RepID=A0A7M7LV44_NASVI|nr:uncharacterized protein LOC103317710 [Nasonia vitripennis]
MASRLLRCFLAVNIGVLMIVVNDCARTSEVDVRPTKMWRFLGNNDEAVLQRFRENIDEFSVGRIKCLRYCIQSRSITDQSPHVLHLIWKLGMKHTSEMGSAAISDRDFTPEILQGKSIKSDDSWNLRSKCTFSIVIGCELSRGLEDNVSKVEKNFIKSLQPNLEGSDDNGSSTLNFVSEKLVDKSGLTNATEIEFSVQPDQAEISAIILGNVSKIDLKMPIGNDASLGSTTRTTPPRLTLATSRMPVGLRLNVLNPPPGGWRLGVDGGEGYRLIVTSALVPAFFEGRDSLDRLVDDGMRVAALEAEDPQTMHKDAGISSRQIRVLDENREQLDVFNDPESNREFSDSMIADGQSLDGQVEPKSFRFPEVKNDVDMMDTSTNFTSRMNTDLIEDRMIDRGSLELDDLTRSNSNELPIKKHLMVDLNPSTNLIANPGTIHQVTFDITNNHILTIQHYFVPKSSFFRIVSVRPPSDSIVIPPGQTISVRVYIQVPPTVSESVLNTVSLQVQGIEALEKTANIYVRSAGSRVFDDVRPTIYYYFNNNCAGRTNAEKCLKSYWSVDITIQDSESGLKSVTSTPRGAYPRSQYVSGTSSPVYFYYSNNCCSRVLEISATDVSGNVYSRRIDVGEWYNLTEGEIAAVVVGVLFIILLIILIVISILYCTNRRSSHDLPYSQRYGSRSAPRSSE